MVSAECSLHWISGDGRGSAGDVGCGDMSSGLAELDAADSGNLQE
jgi:hypothetical protein